MLTESIGCVDLIPVPVPVLVLVSSSPVPGWTDIRFINFFSLRAIYCRHLSAVLALACVCFCFVFLLYSPFRY